MAGAHLLLVGARAAQAGQVSGSQQTFTRLQPYRLMLLAGYAIIDNASFPIVGDPLYGSDPTVAKKLGLDRQWLHAVKLGFEHPGSGEWVTFESPYPADLQHALEVARG